MKRMVLLMASALLVLSVAGCGHEHTYDDGKVTTEATCTAEGEKTYTCTECGQTKVEKIPMVDHKYVKDTVTKEPTCTEEGIQQMKCSECGDITEESIPKVDHKYEEKVTKEPTFESEGEKTFTCSVCGDSYTETIPVRDEEVVVTVTDKVNVSKDTSNYRYSDRIELKIEVENMTDKDIKGVQGTLKVSDMFGAEIMTSNCDFTGKTIPAKQKVTFDELGLDVNQYMDNHTKFYNTDYDDLQFEYTITNVVFADGSAKDTGAEEETSLTASEVDIVVTDKTNLEENYRAGRYSPRVEFTFAVTNNTDKDIRGIQGSLTIMDLFGKEITTIGCDFTGETFAAGETKTISGLGIDINQYIDSDAKLYNEDFSDLQFKYEVTQIVYK